MEFIVLKLPRKSNPAITEINVNVFYSTPHIQNTPSPHIIENLLRSQNFTFLVCPKASRPRLQHRSWAV